MKTVITYGTFDLLHTGHVNLLKRARKLGDRLIVGVTTDSYDQSRGKLNVMESLEERMENVRKTGLADLIIKEELEGQKIHDIRKYGADVFVIGSDWSGKFDYLRDYCEVVYLERTKGVSSTDLRSARNPIVYMGIAGHGRIAGRFLRESKYVSNIEITAVFGRNEEKVRRFAESHALLEYYTEYEQFLDRVHAVYIAVPHHLHYEMARKALLRGKHVLCEKPLALAREEAEELFRLAEEKGVVLLEALKTAFCPAFQQLTSLARSGIIGSIKAVDATFTKLIKDEAAREYDPMQAGGSWTELGSYPAFVIGKLLGTEPRRIRFVTCRKPHTGVDVFTRAEFLYSNAVATATAAIGAKQEGDLCITGTEGYIYVPAPWWKTEMFEVRFEDTRLNRKYFANFEEDGLRYELGAFLRLIHGCQHGNRLLTREDSMFMADIASRFRRGYCVEEIS